MRYEIPGVLWRQEPPPGAELPLLFDSPHSGALYPADFDYTCSFQVLRRAEDAYVDELYGAAAQSGATLIGAIFPRSYIDVNRAPDDLDPAVLADGEAGAVPLRPVTRVGLVRRHAQPGIPIYDRKLSADEVSRRIERYYAPYHRALDEAADRLHAKFGAVWHLNCHSMPSYGSRREGRQGEHGDFVLGDRDGMTCAPEFTDFVARFLRRFGYDVRINEGYKGVEIVRRHGRPRERRHSLQIEVDRALYMDQRSLEKLPGLACLRSNLAALAEALGGFVRERL